MESRGQTYHVGYELVKLHQAELRREARAARVPRSYRDTPRHADHWLTRLRAFLGAHAAAWRTGERHGGTAGMTAASPAQTTVGHNAAERATARWR